MNKLQITKKEYEELSVKYANVIGEFRSILQKKDGKIEFLKKYQPFDNHELYYDNLDDFYFVDRMIRETGNRFKITYINYETESESMYYEFDNSGKILYIKKSDGLIKEYLYNEKGILITILQNGKVIFGTL